MQEVTLQPSPNQSWKGEYKEYLPPPLQLGKTSQPFEHLPVTNPRWVAVQFPI
jgi:hypothetical protein